MNVLEIGTRILSEKLGINLEPEQIQSALTNLMGDGSGNIDVAALVSKFASEGGLQSAVGSWLGDGANQGISAQSVIDMFGQDKISDFAARLGVAPDTAAEGLSEAVPEMVNQASSGGSLLDSFGGSQGVMGMAKNLFS